MGKRTLEARNCYCYNTGRYRAAGYAGYIAKGHPSFPQGKITVIFSQTPCISAASSGYKPIDDEVKNLVENLFKPNGWETAVPKGCHCWTVITVTSHRVLSCYAIAFNQTLLTLVSNQIKCDPHPHSLEFVTVITYLYI